MVEQKQQTINRRLNTKLDRITKMLTLVLERMDESELDSRMMKRIAREWKAISSGRMKVHHYKSLADFDKALG